MKRSLLLLTLIPLCISTADQEVKEKIESVTYQEGWLLERDIIIEKKETPDRITYHRKLGPSRLKVFDYRTLTLT